MHNVRLVGTANTFPFNVETNPLLSANRKRRAGSYRLNANPSLHINRRRVIKPVESGDVRKQHLHRNHAHEPKIVARFAKKPRRMADLESERSPAKLRRARKVVFIIRLFSEVAEIRRELGEFRKTYQQSDR
jgi:hypothetical protein